MKTLLPIILLLGSVLLFVGVTQPVYERALSLKETNDLYADALAKSKELLRVRDSVLNQFRNIPPSGIERLNKLLPSAVDNVRLVRDLDTLARRYSLVLRSINVTVASSEESAASYGVLDITFNTAGNYDTFRSFLRDVEQSLRLMDVTRLSIAATPQGSFSYGVTLRTYWLNQ